MGFSLDWQELAARLGTLHKTGESGSDEDAFQALELLLGEDQIRATVDHVLRRAPGFALARGVLRVLHPKGAIQYCYELYQSKEDIFVQRAVVELLSDIAHPQTLDWIEEFLDDADAEIQTWGVHLLNEIIRSSSMDLDGGEELLSKAERHVNPDVRQRAAEIRTYLKNR